MRKAVTKIRIASLVISAILNLTVVGCAISPNFFANRAHDGADIFTATLGRGMGAKVRVGPITLGLFGMDYETGLRGGGFKVGKADAFDDLQFVVVGAEALRAESNSVINQRKKTFGSFNHVVFVDDAKHGNPLPPAYVWSDIQISGGFLLGFRLGFNPGELVDFILGWAKIDIYSDDIGITKADESRSTQTITKNSLPK